MRRAWKPSVAALGKLLVIYMLVAASMGVVFDVYYGWTWPAQVKFVLSTLLGWLLTIFVLGLSYEPSD